MKLVLAAALALGCAPLAAQNVDPHPGYVEVKAMAVPVVDWDVTDRPYHVIADVSKDVRKATLFSHSVSDEKVRRELWEKGRKLHADAIINVHMGDSHITMVSWGARTVTGQAIKFLTDEEIVARAK